MQHCNHSCGFVKLRSINYVLINMQWRADGADCGPLSFSLMLPFMHMQPQTPQRILPLSFQRLKIKTLSFFFSYKFSRLSRVI